MDYENAVKHYIELRNENSRIDEVAQKEIAANKAKMEKLGVWIQLQAEKDKLESVKTKAGTVFWTVGSRCSLSNSEAFFDFVKKNEAWELLERRAAKAAVGDYINTHNKAPPGVDFTTVRQINVRKS